MAAVTRTFAVDELKALDITGGMLDDVVLADEVVGSGRWTERHRVVFRHDNRLWAVQYESPLTEMQEGVEPFGYGPVTAELVEPYEVTVTKYRAVQAPAEGGVLETAP